MISSAHPGRNRVRARLIAVLLVGIVVMIAVWWARPPTDLTIETGPEGGSYYHDALAYQKILAAQGVKLHLVIKPNSLGIVNDVANPRSGIDAGFIAQDVLSERNAPIYALGQIELQPLFIFANAAMGRRSVLDDLRGRRIVMPPSDSATSDAAMHLFSLYDITGDNTTFTFMPLEQAAKELQAGVFDAGVFMLAPDNSVIRALAEDTGLHLVPLLETKAITTHLPFLRSVMLPRGIYDIADAIPPSSTPMVAAPVGIVVRAGLHPYLTYSLLQAMTKVHSGPTFMNDAGEFPTAAGSQLAVDPLALQYYTSGVPWNYRHLPPWLASAVDNYQVVGLGGLILIGLYLIAIWLADAALAIGSLLALGRSKSGKVPLPLVDDAGERGGAR